MNTSLFTLPVRRKRDIILARQRARQIARLLGLDPRGQATLACGVFEMTCRALSEPGRVVVEFTVDEHALHVRFRRSAGEDSLPLHRLETPLPNSLAISREDVAWIIQQLHQAGPVNCFEEMREQNHELLRTLVEMQRTEADLVEAAGQPGRAAA
jgi:hypothetical protein